MARLELNKVTSARDSALAEVIDSAIAPGIEAEYLRHKYLGSLHELNGQLPFVVTDEEASDEFRIAMVESGEAEWMLKGGHGVPLSGKSGPACAKCREPGLPLIGTNLSRLRECSILRADHYRDSSSVVQSNP